MRPRPIPAASSEGSASGRTARRPVVALLLTLCLASSGCRPAESHAPGSSLPAICSTCSPGVPQCEQEINDGLLPAPHIVEPLEVKDPPPVGGPHHPCWARWVEHTQEIEAGHWVHNLEHGGIVFLYRCPEGCDDERARLRGLLALPRTLLTPYADLPTRFAALSWGHRLLSDCLDLEAFEGFHERHLDRGPESLDSAPSSGCHEERREGSLAPDESATAAPAGSILDAGPTDASVATAP